MRGHERRQPRGQGCVRRCLPERPWEEGNSLSPGACEDDLEGVLGGLRTSLNPWQVPNGCLTTAGERAAGEHLGVSPDSIFSAQMQFGSKSNKPAYHSAAASNPTLAISLPLRAQRPRKAWGLGGGNGPGRCCSFPALGTAPAVYAQPLHAADGVIPPQRRNRPGTTGLTTG